MTRGVEASILLHQACFLVPGDQQGSVGSAEGALQKEEHDGAGYLLSLQSASRSLCLLYPGLRVLGGIRRERQLFILESSHLRTSMSDDSNLPEETAVRDPGIQQPSTLWLLQGKT